MRKPETYLSAALENKMKALLASSVGVLVAPAGFGKTTATLAALASVPSKQKHWFTAVKSDIFYENEVYDWFVSELGSFDLRTALALREKKYFNRVNRYEIGAMIREITADHEQYIIIDNLQYMTDEFADVLISSLAENDCEKIHLILITQFLSPKRRKFLDIMDCLTLRSSDLVLSKAEIAQYAATMSIVLTDEALTKLWQRTEGWIVIVALYLKKVKEQGFAPQSADVNSLLYEICWATLLPEEHHLLLYFHFCQTISESCLAYLLAEDACLPSVEKAHELMNRIPLIDFDAASNSRTMHNLLQEYVTLRFHSSPKEEQRVIANWIGRWEKAEGNDRKAVALFFYAKEYEQLLSCNLTNLLMEDFGGSAFCDIAIAVSQSCSDTLLCSYPISGLKLCYGLYAETKFDEFQIFLQRMHTVILSLKDPHLLGEWTLVSAFSVFPDIPKMTAIYESAGNLLQHPSMVFSVEEPFLFGCTSMWYLFYTKVGQMEALADEMDKMVAVYNTVTGGHGAGAEMLYRGEVYCVQGRFEEAEIIAHTAARMAEGKKNVTVTYGVALLLGIIAIYQDDMIGLEEAIQYLENRAVGYPFMQNTALNRYMTETVRGYLLALLMETQESSSWTREWSASETELTFTNFMVKTTQITDIILHKEYKKAIANVEATLTLDERLLSVPTRNFMHVGLALCYLAIGNIKKATQNLECSLSLSEQDQNFTFLACFRKYLAPLMLLPSIRTIHSEGIQNLKKIKVNYSIARKKAVFDFPSEDKILTEALTDRELEVAKLAAGGMRNKEIAQTLYISEYTVKNHLAIIYQKLHIDRRSKLIEMLK